MFGEDIVGGIKIEGAEKDIKTTRKELGNGLKCGGLDVSNLLGHGSHGKHTFGEYGSVSLYLDPKDVPESIVAKDEKKGLHVIITFFKVEKDQYVKHGEIEYPNATAELQNGQLRVSPKEYEEKTLVKFSVVDSKTEKMTNHRTLDVVTGLLQR